jgi:hypothetical protein
MLAFIAVVAVIVVFGWAGILLVICGALFGWPGAIVALVILFLFKKKKVEQ